MVAVPPDSVEAAAEWLRKHFEPESARGVRLIYQFELSGPGGGPLRVALDDGTLDVGRGRAEAPNVVVRASASDYEAVLAGTENAELLYMAGRITIEGDPSLALRMRTFFSRRRV
jgi:putative sterol carrier protein